MHLAGSVAEIEAGPEGPTIGAFFDLDGTLIAGYSAKYLNEDRLRRREIGASEFLRTFAFIVSAGLGRASFEDALRLGAEAWRGRAQEDLEEMGLRLFEQKIGDRIYPEMRDLVRAHQQQGHTVALTSSATSSFASRRSSCLAPGRGLARVYRAALSRRI
jgi:putative phosphoserine phosphatase/1-acylglycerol-3-phosphate O-acyltransferase